MYFSPLSMREVVAALGPRTRDALGALLPGPVTLVVANPNRLYPLACREDPERLGLRLIGGTLAGAAAAVFQTSANRSGEPAPARFEDVDRRIRDGVDLAIDGGELTGMPSTVVDITGIEEGAEPAILREGALSPDGDPAAARACSSEVKNSSRTQLAVRGGGDRHRGQAGLDPARLAARVDHELHDHAAVGELLEAQRLEVHAVHGVEERRPPAAHSLGPAVDVGLRRHLARRDHLEVVGHERQDLLVGVRVQEHEGPLDQVPFTSHGFSIVGVDGRRAPRGLPDRPARRGRSADRRGARPRARAPAADAGDDRLGELRAAGGARRRRLGAHQQVRRGLPGAPLLRRLRGGRRRRAARDRPRQGAVRGGVRERPAARRRPGQQRRVHGDAAAGRQDHGHGPRPRRPPHPRDEAQRLRQALRGRRLPRAPRGSPLRHGRGRAPRARAQAEGDRRRLVGLPAPPRLRRVPRDRRLGRRAI